MRKAQAFLSASEGYGGTEMMKAIKASLDPSDAQDHVRIVCFMTDGYVGNDMEIISEVQKHPNARVFAFGIGSSVNRFLLDKMSEFGRGEVEYVSLTDDGSAAAKRFHERVRNPLLTDISVDWNGLPVSDVYPQRIPDLFGSKPVILTGRYTGAGSGIIRLKGKMAGREFVREIAVNFPEAELQHNVLSSLWARSRIDDLMGQDYNGAQQGSLKPELQETITNLGLEYRLMTQFTSFVAVEEMIVTDGGQPRRIDVPVEVPEGVNRQDVDEKVTANFGYAMNAPLARSVSVMRMRAQPSPVTKSGTGSAKAKSRGVLTGRAANVGGGGPGGGGGGSPMLSRAAKPAGGLVLADAAESVKVLSPEEQRRRESQAKLHPSIIAVIERLQKKETTPGADEAKFIREGRAEIQIWLLDKSAETLAKLKELGFEIVLDPKSGKVIIGRLSIDKLASLAELKSVRYVSPQVLNK
jgi:Ca-activated chloride channel family protein